MHMAMCEFMTTMSKSKWYANPFNHCGGEDDF